MFRVSVMPRDPGGFDGLAVETCESRVTSANRDDARREAGYLIQALTEQAKSQSGDARKRTERDLQAVVALFGKLSFSGRLPEKH